MQPRNGDILTGLPIACRPPIFDASALHGAPRAHEIYRFLTIAPTPSPNGTTQRQMEKLNFTARRQTTVLQLRPLVYARRAHILRRLPCRPFNYFAQSACPQLGVDDAFDAHDVFFTLASLFVMPVLNAERSYINSAQWRLLQCGPMRSSTLTQET